MGREWKDPATGDLWRYGDGVDRYRCKGTGRVFQVPGGQATPVSPDGYDCDCIGHLDGDPIEIIPAPGRSEKDFKEAIRRFVRGAAAPAAGPSP